MSIQANFKRVPNLYNGWNFGMTFQPRQLSYHTQWIDFQKMITTYLTQFCVRISKFPVELHFITVRSIRILFGHVAERWNVEVAEVNSYCYRPHQPPPLDVLRSNSRGQRIGGIWIEKEAEKWKRGVGLRCDRRQRRWSGILLANECQVSTFHRCMAR